VGTRDDGIFAGKGGPLTTVADTSGRFTTFGEGASINDAGTVAFLGILDAGIGASSRAVGDRSP